MADVVLIPCPHCRNNLRIPAAWAEQPMRCKFCQQVFQARSKPSANAPTTPFSVHRPINGQAAPRATLSPPPLARPVSRRGFPLKAMLVGCCVLAGVGMAAIVVVAVLGAVLLKMFNPDAPTAVARKDNEIVAPIKTPPKDTVEPVKTPKETVKLPPDVKAIDTVKGPSVNPDKPKPPPDKSDKIAQPPDKDKKAKDKDKGPAEKSKGPPLVPGLQHILNELALFPPTTGGKSQPLDPANLPPFSADVLDAYKPNYKQLMDFAGQEAKAPLRAVIAKTVTALRENATSFKMKQRNHSRQHEGQRIAGP